MHLCKIIDFKVEEINYSTFLLCKRNRSSLNLYKLCKAIQARIISETFQYVRIDRLFKQELVAVFKCNMYVGSMFVPRIEYWLSQSINTADNTNNDRTSNKTISLIEADSKRLFTLGKLFLFSILYTNNFLGRSLNFFLFF